MCGILLIAAGVSPAGDAQVAGAAAAGEAVSQHAAGLRARGPDHQGHHQVTVSSSQLALHFAASLLQLRGTSPSTSPLTDERGHVLCFNGELFGGLDVPSGRNDGKQLLAALAAASVEQQPSAAIPALLSRLRGPWSLLFWQQEQQRLWFGRDVMGRRSLLLRDPRSLMQGGQQQQPWQLVLSSVAPLQQQQQALWIEVPPGVYSIGAEQLQQLLASTYAGSCGGSAGPCTQAGSNGSTTGLVRPLQQQAANEDDAAANGGVQSAADLCALLPGLQHHAWQDAELLQLQQYARDSTASAATQQQQQQEPGVDVQLYAAAQQLLQAMEAAVRVRCLTINTLEQQQAQVQQQHADAAAPLPPAPVLVLFSGGVDSTLIAALAHRVLPPGVPIDLSNVCFDGGRSADRIAARAAMLELAATAPDRPWRLIEVDSSLQEVDELSAHIKALLQPAATVMDWNIGSALWLAARATGRVRMPMRCTAQQQQASGQPGQGWHLVPAFCQDQQDQQGQLPGAYRSAARVVLLGHGADEQCGGYGRHRTKFREAGMQGVATELTLDTTRLWLRNLGRDDRLIADHGCEARHPFLDEGVMACLLRTPLPALVDFSKPPGVGDKRILRHVLASLGLPAAAAREKRAIQFGSRIGQLSNKRDFGSNRRANKHSAGGLKVG